MIVELSKEEIGLIIMIFGNEVNKMFLLEKQRLH